VDAQAYPVVPDMKDIWDKPDDVPKEMMEDMKRKI
jgi:hypothetical protein